MKCYREISTTVGITIGYLTSLSRWVETLSTTVEITIGYLTLKPALSTVYLQQ